MTRKIVVSDGATMRGARVTRSAGGESDPPDDEAPTDPVTSEHIGPPHHREHKTGLDRRGSRILPDRRTFLY
ncbi:MAG: hypothetical protein LH467_02145 [Gemmatimonadaceae bacterium]|nr:hypothetical protein [Gemmatimonadaceae bacterium]